jgi:hypothetical protein
MFNIFIAKTSAVLADGQTNTVATGLIIGARVFSVQSPDRIPTFYANWHFGDERATLGVVVDALSWAALRYEAARLNVQSGEIMSPTPDGPVVVRALLFCSFTTS